VLSVIFLNPDTNCFNKRPTEIPQTGE